jgi:hypothetical protein
LRVFLYTLIGIPLLALDAVLLYTLPARFGGRISAFQALIIAGGAAAYLLFHFLIRKPERLYVWGHELTHLIAAKIFLRQVHGFHISSRTGGKVVINRTNVAIDLAPYAIPLYNLAAIVPMMLLRGNSALSREIYLAAAAFLFTMHMSFSLEGFLDSQPDLRRSGRLFSAAAVVICLLLLLPILLAPASPGGYTGVAAFYVEWFKSGLSALRHLFYVLES